MLARASLRLPLGAEQTMGMPAMRHRWRAPDVRALTEASPTHWPRYELIDGELIVTPAPGSVHQIAVSELLALLIPYVDQEALGIALPSPSDLELRPESIVQPDVFVAPMERPVSMEHEGWSQVTDLILAVEVISPSSARTDRIEKRDYYMDVGVPDYWVVDLEARIVEWWRPSHERPEVVRSTREWLPAGARAALVLDLPSFFDRIREKARRLGRP